MKFQHIPNMNEEVRTGMRRELLQVARRAEAICKCLDDGHDADGEPLDQDGIKTVLEETQELLRNAYDFACMSWR